MIESIRHKALKAFYEEGNGSKLPQDLLAKIASFLSALDAHHMRKLHLVLEIGRSQQFKGLLVDLT